MTLPFNEMNIKLKYYDTRKWSCSPDRTRIIANQLANHDKGKINETDDMT